MITFPPVYPTWYFKDKVRWKKSFFVIALLIIFTADGVPVSVPVIIWLQLSIKCCWFGISLWLRVATLSVIFIKSEMGLGSLDVLYFMRFLTETSIEGLILIMWRFPCNTDSCPSISNLPAMIRKDLIKFWFLLTIQLELWL